MRTNVGRQVKQWRMRARRRKAEKIPMSARGRGGSETINIQTEYNDDGDIKNNDIRWQPFHSMLSRSTNIQLYIANQTHTHKKKITSKTKKKGVHFFVKNYFVVIIFLC